MKMFPEISQKPKVAIIYITYNRLYYTKKTLLPLLNSSKNKFKLYIVDNGSNDGTTKFLNQLEHPNIEQIIYNNKNLGLVKPTKKFWDETDAELVGKIDNDILVPPNWIENLVDAHKAIPNLGDNKDTVPSIFKPFTVPRRYIVKEKRDRVVLQFGYGSEDE